MPEFDELRAIARLEVMRRERIRLTNKINAHCLLSRGERARAWRSGEMARVLVWSKGQESRGQMTSEETTALAAFIEEYDPRFAETQAVESLMNQVICTRANGAQKVYFSIADYVDEARKVIAASPFSNALNKWLAERTIAKVLRSSDD